MNWNNPADRGVTGDPPTRRPAVPPFFTDKAVQAVAQACVAVRGALAERLREAGKKGGPGKREGK